MTRSCIILSHCMLSFVFALALIPAFAQSDSGAKDVSNVSDILGGQRTLLSDEDWAFLTVGQQLGLVTAQLSGANTQGGSFATNASPVTLQSNVAYIGNQASATGNFGSIASGRLFNTKGDQVVYSYPGTKSFQAGFYDALSGWQQTVSVPVGLPCPTGIADTQVVMGDFRGDGYKEALIYVGNTCSLQVPTPTWGFYIASAIDPATEGSIQLGPGYVQTGDQPISPQTVAVGDFNGDGRDEFAVLQADGQTVTFFTVDPQTLAISKSPDSTQVILQIPGKTTYGLQQGKSALVAGRFNGNQVSLVALGDLLTQPGNGTQPPAGITVFSINITPGSNGSFTTSLQPYFQNTVFFTASNRANVFGIKAKAVSLLSFPQQTNQQLAILTEASSDLFVDIGSFDGYGGSFDWQSTSDLNIQEAISSASLAFGNFDSGLNPSPTSGFLPGAFPELLVSFVNNINLTGTAYQINPVAGQNTAASGTNWLAEVEVTGTQTLDGNSPLLAADIIPADLQGRSIQLGTPVVVTLPELKQIDTLIALPPMHVDYIVPPAPLPVASYPNCQQDTIPCIYNISVRSGGNALFKAFQSQFSNSSSTSVSSKSSSTTSWGISAGAFSTTSAAISDGENSLSVTTTESAGYTHDHSVSTQYNTYAGTTQDLTEATTTDDLLLFTQQTMNIYYYPVIGSSICPASEPNCSESEQIPEYVEYSVPDDVQYISSGGQKLDWYQPIQENYNALSYPATFTQLGKQYQIPPTVQAQSKCNAVGTGTETYLTSWNASTSNESTSSTSNAFWAEASASATATLGNIKLLENGVQETVGFNVGGNQDFSSLNTSVSTSAATEGFGLTLPGTFDEDATNESAYGIQQFIYGPTPPEPVWQSPTYGTGAASVNFNGPLLTGFTANILNGCSTAGLWWERAYSLPDLSFNHPQRWAWAPSSQDVSFNSAAPNFPDEDPFYEAKGFFVAQHGATSTSPLLGAVLAGSDLDLTLRVYNYSLVATPANATVQVRLYGQYFCSSGDSSEPSCRLPGSSTPCSAGELCGDSFEIGQNGITSPILAYGPESSNWTTTTFEFETANNSHATVGTYLDFWAVTWLQDANGNVLHDEINGHGLTPAFQPGNTFLQITDVPVEPYSNNVGMFLPNQHLFIEPTVGGSLPGASAPVEGSLKDISLRIPSQMMLDSRNVLRATITNGNEPLDGVDVTYYDGNPAAGGARIDQQTIQHMEADLGYGHKTEFQPATCGVHTIYAIASHRYGPMVQTSGTTNVTLAPIPQVQALIRHTNAAQVTDAAVQSSLLSNLNAALTSFQNGLYDSGIQNIQLYVNAVTSAGGGAIPTVRANELHAMANVIIGCNPAAPSFSIESATSIRTIAAGGTATYAIKLASIGGFAGTLTVKCSGAPQGGQCTAAPGTVMLSRNGSGTANISVSTASGVTSAGLLPGGLSTSLGAWLVSLLGFLGSVTVLARGRKAAQSFRAFALVVLLVAVMGAIGCGSGPSMQPSATPPGTYNLTVSVSDGTTTRQTALKLVVQ